jgi:hypothetical protein
MKKSFWCYFGLHRWEAVALISFISPTPLMRCPGCGMGEKWEISGALVKFTKEQMDELIRQGERWQREIEQMAEK